MAVQLKEGAWKDSVGNRVEIVKYNDIWNSFNWVSREGKHYESDGRRDGGVGPDIIGPWEETTDPGPGYRLATEKDVGATVFDVSDDGKHWKSHEKYDNPRLEYNGDDAYPWLPDSVACRWKYARVPVPAKPDDKPQFVPGEWYNVDGVKVCLMGKVPASGRLVFYSECGQIWHVPPSQTVAPWVEPPAFRLCSGVVHGSRMELVYVTTGKQFICQHGNRWCSSQVTVERWHEDSK